MKEVERKGGNRGGRNGEREGREGIRVRGGGEREEWRERKHLDGRRT